MQLEMHNHAEKPHDFSQREHKPGTSKRSFFSWLYDERRMLQARRVIDDKKARRWLKIRDNLGRDKTNLKFIVSFASRAAYNELSAKFELTRI